MRFLLVNLWIIGCAGLVFAQNSPGSPSGSFMSSVLPMMLIMFVIIYIFMIRPEQKKQKDRQKMMGELKKGDKVLTIGGIYGKVAQLKDNVIMLKISDNSTVEITKAAVSSVINRDSTEKDGESDKNSK